MKNIIFIVSGEKKPAGGNKIVYQFSSYINSIKNLSSSVIHLKKKKSSKYLSSINKILFKKKNKKPEVGWKFQNIAIEKNPNIEWANIKIKQRNSLIFNKKEDHVILPEIYAHFASEMLIKNKIPYSIFVQNGYSIMSTNDVKKINLAYKNSKFIISYSKDINECISILFKKYAKKLISVVPQIDYKKLIPNKKKNLITYMPRKLKRHSELLLFFLKNYLPKNWNIKALDNMTEKEVFCNLKNSKIFLSFSELEGLGMPPIEAALAGNKVIGYTGEAGNENWKNPIFTKINNGDIKSFLKKILKNLNNINFNQKIKKQRIFLLKKYSQKNQEKSLLKLIRKIHHE